MSSTPDEDEAEVEAWRDVDPTDPESVARALAALGMRAGAKLATIEHMHARIGRALDAFEEATERLATREDVDRRIKAVEDQQAEYRREDQATSMRRFVGLILVGLLFAAIVATGWALNRFDIQRDDEEDRRFAERSEIVAICASTYPGNEDRIHECVEARVPSRR